MANQTADLATCCTICKEVSVTKSLCHCHLDRWESRLPRSSVRRRQGVDVAAFPMPQRQVPQCTHFQHLPDRGKCSAGGCPGICELLTADGTVAASSPRDVVGGSIRGRGHRGDGGNGCTVLHLADFAGFNLPTDGIVASATAELCSAMCVRRPDCAAYTFDRRARGTCFLKSAEALNHLVTHERHFTTGNCTGVVSPAPTRSPPSPPPSRPPMPAPSDVYITIVGLDQACISVPVPAEDRRGDTEVALQSFAHIRPPGCCRTSGGSAGQAGVGASAVDRAACARRCSEDALCRGFEFCRWANLCALHFGQGDFHHTEPSDAGRCYCYEATGLACTSTPPMVAPPTASAAPTPATPPANPTDAPSPTTPAAATPTPAPTLAPSRLATGVPTRSPTSAPRPPPTSVPTLAPTARPPPTPTTSQPSTTPPAGSGPGPQCDAGIRSGGACCAAACGSCGGTDCGTRPGGGAGCCHGTISNSGRSCLDYPPPCMIAEPATSTPAPPSTAPPPSPTPTLTPTPAGDAARTPTESPIALRRRQDHQLPARQSAGPVLQRRRDPADPMHVDVL